MNKKQMAHFTNLPKINISRSRFNMDYSVKTSFNTGDLIPLGKAFEVLPGDTIKWKTSSLVRMQTLITPVMDNIYLDTFYFFVPFRLIWDHYVNFLGENDTTPWVSDTTYSIPQVLSPENGWRVGTLADYFGVRPGVGNLSISALPFRAYSKIVKDWFYDENIQTPPDCLTNDATIQGSNGDDYVVDLVKGGKPFVVARMHDMFSSALPSPQKGASVILPLGNDAPLRTFDGLYSIYGNDGIKFSNDGINPFESVYYGSGTNAILGAFTPLSQGTDYSRVQATNLRADLSSATATTINDLRLAFQTQRLLERMARGGSRYFEILASQWGVIAPQGLIQRSEYLGGSRSSINVQSVVQTSSTDDTSPQGNLTGYSVSTKVHHDFTKSFSEPGYIIGLGCVRYMHSYSQGIPKAYMRKDRFDFFNHAFAFIGEQPIKNYEIFAQGTAQDNEVFGYNEAFVDYRYNPNMITGEMRSDAPLSLDVWHLGDDYETLPMLSSTWIREDKSNVDRVLAINSSISNQFFGDFYFNIVATRPMPLFSIPGLIDHM